jgi:hypothetical protein
MNVRLGAIAVDCPDPAALGDFYKNVLDLEVMFSSADLVALQGAGVLLTFERIADHQRPSWPGGPVPKRNCQDLWIGAFQATSVSVDSPGSGGVMSMGRSSSLPLWKVAPARTRATRCGALTARQRACAASISL